MSIKKPILFQIADLIKIAVATFKKNIGKTYFLLILIVQEGS